eukprot:TRINITY_DN1515_c0_g1_i2.p1 TRINITY_DN1515_c0_g1~~TRINITY_DN1515_c0_g1_i2.p1  ORF type:complete len:438 (-),score=78.61 TRINITY_DN1515_c0_g1_i2:257-1570(-)
MYQQLENPSAVWQFLLLNVNIWGGLVFGYNVGIVAAALDPMTDDFELTSFSKGVVASAVVFGAMIGSLIGAALCDVFGRKLIMIASGLLVTVWSIASAFVPEGNQKVFIVLVAFRIFLGIGVGLVSVVCPLYVAEMAPKSRRGTFGSFFQLSITFGILVSYLVGLGLQQVPHKYQWRVMLELGAIPGVFLIIVGVMVSESTVWMQRKKGVVSGDGYGGVQEAPAPEKKKGWLSLLSPKNWRVSLTAFMMALGLQLTGINAVMYYAPDIFKSAGVSKGGAYYATIGIGAWNFITTIVAVLVVDRLGRRPLLLIGMTIMIAADIVGGISAIAIPNPAGSYISIICVFVFIAGFEGGIGPLFWIIINELFPSDIRETAASLANALQWAFNLGIALLFPLAVEQMGIGTTYLIFGGIGVASIVYVFLFVRETKTDASTDEP